ncbi:MAG: epoxyqueuosine reductase QueH [Patescibacteria group bacterium]
MAKKNKPKLLFHVCCAPCSGILSLKLREKFDLTVYYDNSNIWPEEEFWKRSDEVKRFFANEGVEFILADWRHDDFLSWAGELAHESERGERCKICYRKRLEATALRAKEGRFEYFATSLSISPHKDAEAINKLGLALAQKYGLIFLAEDWKQNGGFKRSMEFSRKKGFYRQNYCGCEFSVR